jgi:hypothetical protein
MLDVFDESQNPRAIGGIAQAMPKNKRTRIVDRLT